MQNAHSLHMGSSWALKLNIKVQTTQLHLDNKHGYIQHSHTHKESDFLTANKEMDVNDQCVVEKPLVEIYSKKRLEPFKTAQG